MGCHFSTPPSKQEPPQVARVANLGHCEYLESSLGLLPDLFKGLFKETEQSFLFCATFFKKTQSLTQNKRTYLAGIGIFWDQSRKESTLTNSKWRKNRPTAQPTEPILLLAKVSTLAINIKQLSKNPSRTHHSFQGLLVQDTPLQGMVETHASVQFELA